MNPHMRQLFVSVEPAGTGLKVPLIPYAAHSLRTMVQVTGSSLQLMGLSQKTLGLEGWLESCCRPIWALLW